MKHWSDEKYLYINYLHQNWKCMITGGIEENEDSIAAAKRELLEESGYKNIEEIQEMPLKMVNVFYAAHKGVNRYSTVYPVYIKLENGIQDKMSEEEKNEHFVNWASKEELECILINGFTDQIWLLKQVTHEKNSYLGNGMYINSDFLNGLENTEEAIQKVLHKLN